MNPDRLAADVDRFTRRLLHTSQHNRCVIWVAGRIQEDVNALRAAVGLREFGWNDAVPDEEVGRCSVHVDSGGEQECVGQHTHDPPRPAPPGAVTFTGWYPLWVVVNDDTGEDAYERRVASIHCPGWLVTEPDGIDRYRAQTEQMADEVRSQVEVESAAISALLDTARRTP